MRNSGELWFTYIWSDQLSNVLQTIGIIYWTNWKHPLLADGQIVVSFVMESGVRLLLPGLKSSDKRYSVQIHTSNI